jgi:hypothetical protein
MFKKLLSAIVPQNPAERRAEIYRDIIRRSAKMGGTLFGPVPDGVRREFFCLDEHTWVWHEEWTDASGVRRTLTTRYDVRPQGIYKAQDGQPYQPVTAEEAHRLYAAAQTYRQRLHEHFDPLLAAAV